MSESNINTVIISVVVGIIISVIEILIITPLGNATRGNKEKVWTAVMVAASLVAPVLLFREIALKVAEAVGQYVSVTERVDIYANLYAILALAWGCIWITRVRPWLYNHLQNLGQNGSKKGELRNE